jgi:hypothetical protein
MEGEKRGKWKGEMERGKEKISEKQKDFNNFKIQRL